MLQTLTVDHRHFLASEAIVHSVMAIGTPEERRRKTLDVLETAAEIAPVAGALAVGAEPVSFPADADAFRSAFGDSKMVDGVLDPQSHAALVAHMVGSAMAAGSDLPVGLDVNDVGDALRSAIGSLPTPGESELASLLQAARLPASIEPEALIGHLPEKTAGLARFLIEPGSDGPALLKATIVPDLTGLFNSSVGPMRDLGGPAAMLPDALGSLQRTLAPIQSYGTVAQYVLGTILERSEEARAVAGIVQAGMAVAQIYMMFSTGGLSVLSGGSGALSAFSFGQQLGGGGGDNMGAVLAQLDALKTEMRQGFARLEKQGRQIIEMLDQALKKQQVALAKLNDLAANLAHMYAYVEGSNRHARVTDFRYRSNALRLSPSPADPHAHDHEISAALLNALTYALAEASGPDFVGMAGDRAWPHIFRTDRADLSIVHLPAVCRHLAIEPVALTHNPCEWARGASACAEGLVRWVPPLDASLQADLERCRQVGKRLESSTAALTTGANLERAAIKVREDFEKLLTAVENHISKPDNMKKLDLKHAWIGRFPAQTFGPTFHLYDTGRLPETHNSGEEYDKFKFDTFLMHRELTDDAQGWSFAMSQYPDARGLLGALISEGYVELRPLGPDSARPPNVQDGPDNVTAAERSQVYTVRSRGIDLGEIRRWWIKSPSGRRFEAWEVAGAMAGRGVSWWKSDKDRAEPTQRFFEDLVNISNDSRQIETGVASFFAEERPELDAYFESIAGASLIYALAGWRKTGRLDDPRAVPAFALLPRPGSAAKPAAEFQNLLTVLATHIPDGLLPFLDDIPDVPRIIAELKAAGHDGSKPIDITKRAGTISYSSLLGIMKQYWFGPIPEGMRGLSDGLAESRGRLIPRTLLKLEAAEKMWFEANSEPPGP